LSSVSGFLVALVLRHGEGDEAHRSPSCRGHRIKHADLQRQGLGLLEMLMAVVPVAQVQPGRDVGGHLVDAAHQASDDRVEGLRTAGDEGFLQDAEFHRDIPLHRHITVGDSREQPAQVGEHGPLVGAQQRLLLLGNDVGADRGERRRVLDLKPHADWDDALVPQRGEGRIRRQVSVGVAEIGPAHVLGIDPVGQAQLWQLLIVPIRGVQGRRRNQGRRLQELLHPRNGVACGQGRRLARVRIPGRPPTYQPTVWSVSSRSRSACPL
jgi:hypothetical protein